MLSNKEFILKIAIVSVLQGAGNGYLTKEQIINRVNNVEDDMDLLKTGDTFFMDDKEIGEAINNLVELRKIGNTDFGYYYSLS